MSPQGIYIGLTLDELQIERTAALERVRNGDRTALSGAGKSSARSFSLSAGEALREINYAIGLLSNNGAGTPARFAFSPISRR